MEYNEQVQMCDRLRNNTVVEYAIFERLNLKILSVAYRMRAFDLTCWVEIGAMKFDKIELPINCTADSVIIKLNFYEEGKLLYCALATIKVKNFIGYDTVETEIKYCDHWIKKVTSVKVYATLA